MKKRRLVKYAPRDSESKSTACLGHTADPRFIVDCEFELHRPGKFLKSNLLVIRMALESLRNFKPTTEVTLHLNGHELRQLIEVVRGMYVHDGIEWPPPIRDMNRKQMERYREVAKMFIEALDTELRGQNVRSIGKLD